MKKAKYSSGLYFLERRLFMSELELLELFSKNLRRMMKEDNIRQEELSNEIGVSQQMISRYMNGQSIPSFITVVKIADALFCSLDEFLK